MDPQKYTQYLEGRSLLQEEGTVLPPVGEDLCGVDGTSDPSRVRIKWHHGDSVLLALSSALGWLDVSVCQMEAATSDPAPLRFHILRIRTKICFLGTSAQISVNTLDSDGMTCPSLNESL